MVAKAWPKSECSCFPLALHLPYSQLFQALWRQSQRRHENPLPSVPSQCCPVRTLLATRLKEAYLEVVLPHVWCLVCLGKGHCPSEGVSLQHVYSKSMFGASEQAGNFLVPRSVGSDVAVTWSWSKEDEHRVANVLCSSMLAWERGSVRKALGLISLDPLMAILLLAHTLDLTIKP